MLETTLLCVVTTVGGPALEDIPIKSKSSSLDFDFLVVAFEEPFAAEEVEAVFLLLSSIRERLLGAEEESTPASFSFLLTEVGFSFLSSTSFFFLLEVSTLEAPASEASRMEAVLFLTSSGEKEFC